MKKMNKIEGNDLPEPIIQHIQSLLTVKEAASTVVLSKSWYNSWSTLPNLDFDERNFQNQKENPQDDENFWNFMTKTIERYLQLNLNIDRLKLRMSVRDVDSSSLATELIVKAVKLGVNSLSIEINPPIAMFVLPNEMFQSESLIELSVLGCQIDFVIGEKIMCSGLKSLSLCKVSIGDDMIRDIMSECTLIEDLSLSGCYGFSKVDVSKMCELEKVSIVRLEDNPFVSGNIYSIEFEETEFHKLNSLLLERVEIDINMFRDFSKKFPCIEDLTIRHCHGCLKFFEISSNSLKTITLAHSKQLKIKFDVPNIQKLNFSGSTAPAFSFTTTLSECEFDISLSCWSNLHFFWFLRLHDFLTCLSGSKVSLKVEVFTDSPIDIFVEPTQQDWPIPTIDNLILKVHSCIEYCDFFDGLFWSCRPKVITHSLFPIPQVEFGRENSESPEIEFWKSNNELSEALYTKLMNLENGGSLISFGKMISENELEGVCAESFEDTLVEWRPLKTLLDVLLGPKEEVQIRLQLRWRPT